MTTNNDFFLYVITKHGSEELISELDERCAVYGEDEGSEDTMDRVDALSDLYNVMLDNAARGQLRKEIQGLFVLAGSHTVHDPNRYLQGGNEFDFTHNGVRYSFDHSGGFHNWLSQEHVPC